LSDLIASLSPLLGEWDVRRTDREFERKERWLKENGGRFDL
jgi:hypothetical protein